MKCTSGPSRKRVRGRRLSEQLKELSSAGITIIELMPIGESQAASVGVTTESTLFAPTRLVRNTGRFSTLCGHRTCLRNRRPLRCRL
jgi:hypothetical protein